MRPFLAAAAGVLLTLLTGCGTLEPAAPGGRTQDMVAYYRYAAALNSEARSHELANFRDWVQEGTCEPDRIRLAILTLQADRAGEARPDPATVLAPCLEGAERPPPGLRNMAFLLQDQLDMRAELRQRVGTLRARLEDLEKEVARHRERRQALARRKGELEKRVESLREQLEALKSIERSIRQRN